MFGARSVSSGTYLRARLFVTSPSLSPTGQKVKRVWFWLPKVVQDSCSCWVWMLQASVVRTAGGR